MAVDWPFIGIRLAFYQKCMPEVPFLSRLLAAFTSLFCLFPLHVLPSVSGGLYIRKEYVPHGHNMAYRAEEDEEMEDSVHVWTPSEAVEDGTGDVADTFGHYPYDRRSGHTVEQRFEGNEHTQSHQHKTDGLPVAVFLEFSEAGHRAYYRCHPHKSEKQPPPNAFVAHGNECNGGIGTGDVPVDSGMIPFAQVLFPPC